MKNLFFWLLAGLPAVAMAQPNLLADTRPLKAVPQATVADRTRVMDYFQNQQYDEAIDYLNPALGLDSVSVGVLSNLGYAYYMTDEYAAAQRCYHRVFVIDSTNVGALHYLEALNQHDDPESALDYVRRLVVLQPSRSAWWRTKGELERRLKHIDSAYVDLGQAYSLAPAEVKNVTAFADLLIERKEWGHADSILEAGLMRDSMNFSLLKLRMRSAYNQKDYALVLEPGERVMRMNLPDINVQSWLALSYYNLKRYPDCVRACEFLLDAGYDVESVYYYEARALSKMGKYNESNELLSICLKKAIEPTGGWYYNDKGDNFEGLGLYREALAQYDTAWYIYKDPLMLYNCGRIAESHLKNEGLARRYYAKYLALAKPDTEDEKKVYGYVRRKMKKGK